MENIKHLDIYELCKKSGVKLTSQREIIAGVINNSKDHPDVDKIYQRANKKNSKISLATVYRTVKLFEDANVIIKHDFKDGKDKSRYEPATKWEHNHLIDVVTGKVIEFQNPGFEKLSRKIAEKKGYKVIGYKLELFAIKEACKKIK
ncbi:MAG: transcriptional repressor [Alphaproteobacteria bacterium]|nr:transcriptional repressor [Alphaproteobacteria bacterium]